jgi:glycosyltransferase involved in cell wall biosynthesis
MMTLFETDRIPATWPGRCNKGFRETWVPNSFNMKSFANSGVKNLHKIRYGVNLSRFNLKVKELDFPKDDYKFFSTFDFAFRKNPHGLISAYYKAFRQEDPVVLYIKAWNIPSSQFRGYLNKFKCNGNRPKVVFIPSIVTDSKMARLYKTADCFIMPSYGEGWSMPAIQAMACGTPVIATNWGGQLEYMNTKNSYLIAVRELIACSNTVHYKNFMRWAKPNTNHLTFLMRYVFEHQKEARKKGLKGHRDVQKFSWKSAAESMKKRAEKLCGF